MPPLSQEFIEKKLDEADLAGEEYIKALYNFLQCIDLTSEGGSAKAHGILSMIEQIQRIHTIMKNPESTREDRVKAFGGRY